MPADTAIDPALVFRLANGLALVCWLALVASPPSARRTPTVWRVTGWFAPLLLSALYLAMLALNWRGQGGFSSVEAVRALFDVPGVLVAGWVHYLAFDLFVGSWIAARCADAGIRHGVAIPLLLLTFLAGPIGLLGFAAVRRVHRPRYPIDRTGTAR